MTDATPTITGRCLCGAVTYRAEAEPVIQGVCHCSDCQRQTGTAFSVIVGVPRAAFAVEGDSLASFTTTSEDQGTPTVRHFCSACGSPIVSFPESVPDFAFIKAGTLDDASWITPAFEIWTRSAQPWSPEFAGAARLERGPS